MTKNNEKTPSLPSNPEAPSKDGLSLGKEIGRVAIEGVSPEYSSQAEEDMTETPEHSKQKKENNEQVKEEQERAVKDYYQKYLEGEKLIYGELEFPNGEATDRESGKQSLTEDEEPQESKSRNSEDSEILAQSPNCKVAVVVPVYSEEPGRVLRQLESILDQQNVDHRSLEIIYVVNNGPPPADRGERERYESAFSQNQAVLNLPIWLNREAAHGETEQLDTKQEELCNRIRKELRVFVIDKSSPGHEIPDCNVGKARNRGLAEASYRFYRRGENGIIVQSDADTTFENPAYFASVLREFEDENLIGLGGGVEVIIDPDRRDDLLEETRSKVINQIIRLRQYKHLTDFIKYGEKAFNLSSSFSGANMVSRSYESAVVGGFIDASMGEDPAFGRALGEYAELHGQKVETPKDNEELSVRTALRLSDRTGASIGTQEGGSLEEIMSKKVMKPGAPSLEDFRTRLKDVLLQADNETGELDGFFKDANGNLLIDKQEIAKLRELLRGRPEGLTAENISGYQPLIEWSNRVFNQEKDIARKIWESKYIVKLDGEVINDLKKMVSKMKGGEEFIKDVERRIYNFRVLNGLEKSPEKLDHTQN